MRLLKKTYKSALLFAALLLTVQSVTAQQDNTLNVFTPYSFYGVGSLNTSGTAGARGMSGVGAAVRSTVSFNTVNPASYSAAPAQTFLFSFGMLGQNDYLKSERAKSSHNGFNINDISLQFPVAKKVGFGFSVSPYSSVGYQTSFIDKNSGVDANIGSIQYLYSGSGGITQFKAGLGWEPLKGLSIGANFLYYLGKIQRKSQTLITPIISASKEYRSISISDKELYSHLGFDLGIQYGFKLRGDRKFTLGAVYEPGLNSTVNNSRIIESVGTALVDSVYVNKAGKAFSMPQKLTAGFAYNNDRMVFGVDYTYQNWANSYYINPLDRVELTSMHQIKAGLEITPNRYDIRNAMKRWTYRAGVRYGNSYFKKDGHSINEYAATFGFGVPLQKNSFTLLNVGLEVGQTGTIKNNLVRDTFVKLSIGFNIFTTSEWFVRHKFK